MRVCQTMVVRPRCSGVHSAFATSPIGTAAKKLVLLSICRGGLTRLEIGGRRRATEIVGKRHEGAAMHDAETVVKIIARDEFCGHPFGRNMRDLEAEKFGKWRLLVGRVVHSIPQPK